MILLELLHNLALLTALTIAYPVISHRWHVLTARRSLFNGLLFGALAVLGMGAAPVEIAPGVIFDGRSMVLGIGGFVGGPLAALLAGSMAAAYRVAIGGPGMAVGVGIIASSAGIGALFHTRLRGRTAPPSTLELAAFALTVHAAMALLLVALPGGVRGEVWGELWPALLVLYPAMTLLIARIFVDTRIRRRNLERLESRERRFRAIAEASGDGLIVVDPDDAIVFCNGAAAELAGIPDAEALLGTPAVELFAPEHHDEWRRRAGDEHPGTDRPIEVRMRHRDGSEIPVELTLSEWHEEEVRFVSIQIRDIRPRLAEGQLKAELRQSQKMEAVGQLAGGIAHDFNNLLGGILTNAQLLELTVPEDPEILESLADIVSSARRGSDLVRRLMSLARQDEVVVHAVDVNASVQEAARTIRRVLPEDIDFTVRSAEEPLTVLLDEGELHQALFNLCNNSRDAMPGGGELTLELSRIDESTAEIAVRDTGSGIPAELAARIFEPFVTTKAEGKGTGLGLSMVRRFAEHASGEVVCRSTVGEGTTMLLLLPLATPGTPTRPQEAAEPVREVRRYSGIAVLAEDDELLRKTVARILEEMGFEVRTAVDGGEALAILDEARNEVRVVIADLVMPRAGGATLFDHTADWDRRPAFLLTSGHTDAGQRREDIAEVPYIPKPWTLDDLRVAIETAVEAREKDARLEEVE